MTAVKSERLSEKATATTILVSSGLANGPWLIVDITGGRYVTCSSTSSKVGPTRGSFEQMKSPAKK